MPDSSQGPNQVQRGIAVVLLVLLLGNSFRVDWGIVVGGGSIDYRNRVTGARLLADRMDAFHYKWQPGQPEEYCDVYNNLAVPVSKTTVTPTLLALMIPAASLPYRANQLLWLLLQWMLLLGTGYLWWRLLGPGWKRWLWAALICGFTYTLAWRLHIDRGQFYVLLSFLVALWLGLTKAKSDRAAQWAGAIAGLLICLRPPYLLLLGPFLWLKGRNQWRGAIISTCVFLVLPMFYRLSTWTDYAAGMKSWSQIYRADHNPRPPAQSYPAQIEGIDINILAKFQVVQYADSSLFRLLRSLGLKGFPDWPVLLLFVAAVGFWFWKIRSRESSVILTGIAAWTFLADWFLPAYRNPYNDVLVLSSLALALQAGRRWFWISLGAFPAGWILVNILPSARWPIHIPTLLLLACALPALFPAALQGRPRRP